MKDLFLREGWTAETFLADLNWRLGYQLDPAVEETFPMTSTAITSASTGRSRKGSAT